MRRILILTGIALAALIGLPSPATAVPTPITKDINLDAVFTGGTPDGTAPWLTAQFTSTVGSKTGTLVLISHTPDFLQGLNSTKSTIGWAFYLDQALSGLTCTTGTCADNNALYNPGGLNAGPVPGVFNLGFGWSSKGRFEDGDTATYSLTFSNALAGNPFVANSSGLWSVAHVQGITGSCESSGWIVSGDAIGAGGKASCATTPPPVVVPEPGELGMFGLGLLFAGLFLGLRRRYN